MTLAVDGRNALRDEISPLSFVEDFAAKEFLVCAICFLPLTDAERSGFLLGRSRRTTCLLASDERRPRIMKRAMTVKELREALAKFPPHALVAWRDHDQDEGEINSKVRRVERFNQRKSFDKEFTQGVGVVLGG